ncbi:response regulator [Phormidesmis sp. 146-35]
MMNTLSTVEQQPFQRLHPLSLLAQLISRHSSGCLRVVDGSTDWLIYLDQGWLTYASSSVDPFERLDRHLRHLSRQIPGLVSAVRVQVRVLFETNPEHRLTPNADFQAIRWLVEQHYLNLAQATALIEAIAKEVIESFLVINEGSYEVVEKREFADYPNLCQLDLRSLVEHCHNQLRVRQFRQSPAAVPSPPVVERLPEPTSSSRQQEFSRSSAQLKTFNRNGGAASASSSRTRHTIACIDDSPTILQSINSFLEEEEFSVLMINDPVKALMQVVRSRPDLILLDVGMPNLDGYELCSLLRRHPNCKNTPIVMVTGNTGFIDRAKAKLVGASGYLTKPFTQTELLKMVFKHLT